MSESALASCSRRILAIAACTLVATAGLLTACAGTSTAVTVSPSATAALPANEQIGLFDDLEYLSGEQLSQRLDQYAALGLRWARFQMIWGTVQRNGPGTYDWSPYDALVQGLVARGIEPLVVVDTSPTWDRVAGCDAGLTCAPAEPGPYAAFVAAATARYAPMGVHAWELWNEPNSNTFWAPSPDPVAYSALLRAAYPAIKAVDPRATVITGGLAATVDTGGKVPSQIAPVEYLARLYAAGGGGSFDAVGWHPYTYPALPGVSDPGSAWYQMYGSAPSVRSLMAEHGDGAKKVWVTEFGAPTRGPGDQAVSPAMQAESFSTALHLWSSYTWAGPFIGYQFQDRSTSPSSADSFGLVDATGVPKPAYVAVKSAITAMDAGVRSSPTGLREGGYRLVASDGGIFSFGAPFRGSALGLPAPTAAAAGADGSYWEVTTTGQVSAFGSATIQPVTGGTLTAPVVALVAQPSGTGYWVVGADGSVEAHGSAPVLGSLRGVRLDAPVVGASVTPDGQGYWLVAADGGVFGFGDAHFLGSMGGHRLDRPVVGIASVPSGGGYFEVASDGGIFTFGTARFAGSTGGIDLVKPVVGMQSTPDGGGYRLVAADGGVFCFGDAPFLGSTGGVRLAEPIVGMSFG